MRSKLNRLSLALWWGSLTSIGFIAVPLLFVHLESPQVAGRMAAVLFNALGFIAWVCGTLLLVTNKSQKTAWLIALALLTSVLIHFGVSPRIVAREDLRMWHSMGSALFGLQWTLVTALLLNNPEKS